MEKQIVVSKSEEGIAEIRLHRPASANALSLQMLNELQNIFEDLKYDKFIRCVIITGSGEKVFCAGADLKERADMDPVQVRKTVAFIRKNINDVSALPQPVIAAINGAAFGGGTELALACDIRVASENAKFALTETSLGIIPGAGGTQRLPRLIGIGRAKELIFTARKIDALEAERIGLVEYVVPQDQLMEKVYSIARQIVQNAPIAVTQAKIAMNRGGEVDLNTALSIEQHAYEFTIPTKDRMEGLQAFKEKRKAVYKGE